MGAESFPLTLIETEAGTVILRRSYGKTVSAYLCMKNKAGKATSYTPRRAPLVRAMDVGTALKSLQAFGAPAPSFGQPQPLARLVVQFDEELPRAHVAWHHEVLRGQIAALSAAKGYAVAEVVLQPGPEFEVRAYRGSAVQWEPTIELTRAVADLLKAKPASLGRA